MYDISACYEAFSVAEAISLMKEYPQARIIAGGSDLFIQIRDGRLSGVELISIHEIDELKGVSLDECGAIRIGALTSFSHVASSPVIKERIPVLGEAVSTVGSPQIRNLGTIGGNICNGSPAADSPPTLFAFDTQVEVTGPEGVRIVPIKDFYLGPKKVDLAPGELLTAIIIPRESYEGYSGNYIKYASRNALDISVVSCSVNVKLSEDKKSINNIRAAFGAVGPVPLRALLAEREIVGREVGRQTIEDFSEAIKADIRPWDDWRTSKEFREHIAVEIAKRTLEKAILLGGGAIS